MTHALETRDGVTIVRLRGRVTVGNALEEIRTVVEEQIAGSRLRVVFDLADVSFVDSAGLGELVACHRSLDGLGGRLALAGARGKVKDLIALTRIDELLDVHADVDSAVAALNS